MNDRHTADSITSDALDQLYARLEFTEFALARMRDRAEVTVVRVRAVLDDPAALDWRQRIGAAIEGPPCGAGSSALNAAGNERCALLAGHAGRHADGILTWPVDAVPASAATEATGGETTTRITAALHRSAEQDVTRVIGLYERWVKTGPPPLGTPMARWWDRRLAELHAAILPFADQTKEQ